MLQECQELCCKKYILCDGPALLRVEQGGAEGAQLSLVGGGVLAAELAAAGVIRLAAELAAAGRVAVVGHCQRVRIELTVAGGVGLEHDAPFIGGSWIEPGHIYDIR